MLPIIVNMSHQDIPQARRWMRSWMKGDVFGGCGGGAGHGDGDIHAKVLPVSVLYTED